MKSLTFKSIVATGFLFGAGMAAAPEAVLARSTSGSIKHHEKVQHKKTHHKKTHHEKEHQEKVPSKAPGPIVTKDPPPAQQPSKRVVREHPDGPEASGTAIVRDHRNK